MTVHTIPYHPDEHSYERPPRQLLDALGRKVEVGDIISYKSGGFFNNFMSTAFVTQTREDIGSIRVINHNGNGVTIWNVYNCVILAKSDNYDLIPEEYLRKLGVIY